MPADVIYVHVRITGLGSITAGRRFLSGCSSPMTRSSLPASDWHKTKVFIA